MDTGTGETGKFLRELRNEKNLKQKEVAEVLQISDKAISRWETGRGIPDIDSLQGLSDFYNVSINEILAGKRVEREDIKEVADENVKKMIKKTFSLKKKLITAVIGMTVILICSAAIIIAKNKPMLGVSYGPVEENNNAAVERMFEKAAELEAAGIDYSVELDTKNNKIVIKITDNKTH